MANTPRIIDIERVVHGNKVKTDFIAAPFTQIRNEQGNPRRIPDLANNLKPSFGVERVMVSSIKKLDREFGINGESVYEVSNKDSRLRFVGDWGSFSDVNSSRPVATVPDQFLEFTFYGTGISVLTLTASSNYSIDGGAEVNFDSGSNNTITARNYGSNIVVPLASGLSLGVHTLKIKSVSGISIYGFEILNEAAQLTVNPGQPFVGGFASKLDAQALLDLKPTALTGTKGGRVLTYLDEEGNIGQAVQAVDVTPQYLASTNHSNEEIVRSVNFREFGRNRADDFSTLAGAASDRAFTLDDGTTTLVGNDVNVSGEEIGGGVSFELIITFIGTGLDFIGGYFSDGLTIGDVIVDNVVVGTWDRLSGRQKICSGLPYGTHTVKFTNGGVGSFGSGFIDFIIYQPKKPALPEGAIEIADYNVMADYVPSVTIGHDSLSQGILRKQNTREFIYEGTWSVNSLNPEYDSGFQILTNTNGDTVSYTFFGTGCDFKYTYSTAVNARVSLDGALLGTTGDVTVLGGTYNSGTSIITESNHINFQLTNLSLGVHTITFEKTTGSNFIFQSVGAITPIHMNSSDLKTGSLALADLRADSDSANVSKNKVDLSKAKAWITYDQTTNEILNSHNISAVLDISTGVHRVYLKHPFKDANYVVVDGSFGNSKTSTISQQRDNLEVRATSGGTASTRVDIVFSLVFFGELENEEDISLDDL